MRRAGRIFSTVNQRRCRRVDGIQPNPHLIGTRVTFELDPDDARDIELRLALTSDGERVSEVWLYRWSA